MLTKHLYLVYLIALSPFFLQAQLPFYCEDFSETGLPSGWTSSDLSSNPPSQQVFWTHCSDPLSCAPYTLDYFPLSFRNQPFASPTANNGYLVANSSAADLAITDDFHLSQLVSAPIDCSDQDQVVLRFFTHLGVYSSIAYKDATLSVSTDGDTWTDFPLFPNLSLDDFDDLYTPIAMPVYADLSAVAAGASTVYLRWNWKGKLDWAWAIDDVCLLPAWPPDYRVVWQEDFSDGLLDWEVVNTPAFQAGWTVAANGYFGNALLARDGFYLSSPTWFNGAAIMNADYYTTGGNSPPPPPYPLYRSELISPIIDLSQQTESINLRFWQIVRKNGADPSFPGLTNLAYSLDAGDTWSPWIDVNPQLITNDLWRPERKDLLLPDTLLGQAEVQLKFGFAGQFYAWGIDDIAIYQREAHDLALKPNFFARPPNLQTPSNMVTPWFFLTDIQNQGTAEADAVKAFVQIFDDQGATLHVDSVEIGNLAPGESVENQLFTNPFFAPAQSGSYRGIYYVVGQATDQRPENNTIPFHFQITDTTFAKELGPTAAFTPQSTTDYSYGNCFYVPSGVEASACQISFAIGNAPFLGGQTISILLCEWLEGDVNDDFIASPDEYEILSIREYTLAGSEDELTTVPLVPDGSGVPLQDDAYYLVIIRYEDPSPNNTLPLFMETSEAEDFQATFYLYDTLSLPRFFSMLDLGNTDEYSIVGLGETGFGQIPVVRLEICGTDTPTRSWREPEGEVRVLPNPVSDVLTVDLSDLPKHISWRARILTMDGQILWSSPQGKALPSSFQQPVQQFPAGVLYVEISGGGYQKLIPFVHIHR
jgi:hypothetical protein